MTSATASRLARLIHHHGPLPVSRFMAEAAGDYYAAGDPFGAAGDFTTAPEISQMFGELLGLWTAQTWLALGRPRQLRLVELGPGRGTLMADALRAAATVPGLAAALRIHLVETSPALRTAQAARLGDAAPTWHARFAEVPDDGPLVVLANEFFDALPIRQFVRGGDGWHERLVDLAPAGGFRFVLAPAATAGPLLPDPMTATPGAMVEICPAGRALAGEIAERLARRRGAALIVDYGYAAAPPDGGDTLQAVRRHRFHPVLDSPGEADLTAHVDFAALAAAASPLGVRTHGPVPQGTFLERLGLGPRAARLARDATPEQAASIAAARQRLTAPEAMGTLFLAMAFSESSLPVPAGFAE